MQAGPDLDKAVAEALGQRVCGGTLTYPKTYRPALTCSKCLASTGSGLHREGDTHLPPPPYSTSWAAAGELVEEMRRRGYEYEIRAKAAEEHSAEFWPPPERVRLDPLGHATAPTAPAAIALAALRALGERREGK